MEQTVHGVIVNCHRVKVRSRPTMDSSVENILLAYTSVVVYINESTDEFYKIRHFMPNFSMIEGYIRKEFIDINEAEG